MKNLKNTMRNTLYLVLATFLLASCDHPTAEKAEKCVREIYPNADVYIRSGNYIERCVIKQDSNVYEVNFSNGINTKVTGVTKLYRQ